MSGERNRCGDLLGSGGVSQLQYFESFNLYQARHGEHFQAA